MKIRPYGEEVVFFRKDGFYMIRLSGQKPTDEEVPEHVALNVGTLRVEGLDGRVIWPPASLQ